MTGIVSRLALSEVSPCLSRMRHFVLARACENAGTDDKGGGLAILARGPQPRQVPVRTEYARPLAGTPGVDGVIKSIDFGSRSAIAYR
jgi:hypothetical protein